MISLYDVKSTDEFIFYRSECYKNSFGVQGILANNYVIVFGSISDEISLIDKSHTCYQLSKRKIAFLEDDVLSKHQIYVGSIDHKLYDKTTDKAQSCYWVLSKMILQNEYLWLTRFFNYIKKYLQQRIVENKSLTTNDSVRIALAECVEHIVILQKLLFENNNTFEKNEFVIAAESLQNGIKTLGAVAGGRAFAGGNVLELFWVISLINGYLLKDMEKS